MWPFSALYFTPKSKVGKADRRGDSGALARGLGTEDTGLGSRVFIYISKRFYYFFVESNFVSYSQS